MNWELLYKLEKEEVENLNYKLKLETARVSTLKNLRLSLEKQKEELLQEIENLKAQIATQNVAPKEKLVERIIIETY